MPPLSGTSIGITPDVAPRRLEFPRVESEILRPLRLLLHPTRQGQSFGLMCVRVDAVDSVETLLGPSGGQEMLAEAYSRLRKCVRTTDLVAGGEGGLFFILATDLQFEDELEIISNRIQLTCRQPYWISAQKIRSALTTGGVGGSEGQADPATLIRFAVLAMRRASSRGVAFKFYNPDPVALDKLRAPVPTVTADDPFELNFIPDFTPNKVLSGARVILRMAPAKWKSGGKDNVGQAAERPRNGRIGDRVLLGLLKRSQAWAKAGLIVPTLSIEIGATHLLTPGFGDNLLRMLSEADIPGSAIELLLTEATALSSLVSAKRTLDVLAEAGVRFGLCGFSLNSGARLDLRKLPFSSLRVSCVSLFRATSAVESLWIARSIIGVAHRCGLTVVGEDVDTNSQRDILLECGCDLLEGKLFSAALDASAMKSLLRPAALD